ncbi:MAG: cation:proton antiporter [Desulfosalsimonadaceae bacterium]
MDFLASDIGTTSYTMIFLGAILAVSILIDAVALRTRLPRISLLVLLGVSIAVFQQGVLGMEGGRPLGEFSEPLINLALVMVAFLLGGELTISRLRLTGVMVLTMSLAVTIIGATVVGLGLGLIGYSLPVAISLAAISVATDPAAVTQTVRDLGDNRLRARVILGVVAIDDAWGIIVFGLAMAVLSWLVTTGDGVHGLSHPLWELGGAVLIGTAAGLPAAWLTGRLSSGEPTQVEAIALILLMAGLASWLKVSALLLAMVAGFVIANLSSHHTRSFNEIELIEWPFLVFFFVLSGASINLSYIYSVYWLSIAYIVLRVVGRYLGGWLGVRLLRPSKEKLPGDIGLALTPQAGVAMGMALLAAERFPEKGTMIVATVVTSTIVFELFGPLLVKRTLR